MRTLSLYCRNQVWSKYEQFRRCLGNRNLCTTNIQSLYSFLFLAVGIQFDAVAWKVRCTDSTHYSLAVFAPKSPLYTPDQVLCVPNCRKFWLIFSRFCIIDQILLRHQEVNQQTIRTGNDKRTPILPKYWAFYSMRRATKLRYRSYCKRILQALSPYSHHRI